MTLADRIRILEVIPLADDWGALKKTVLDFRRGDGTWQRISRETYDRGHGATILLYNLAARTVVLTRQFRFPAFATGHAELLLETPAGLLDDATPEDRIRIETEEETGFRLRDVRKLFEAFMSPGSVTERLTFFEAHYEAGDRSGAGGGNEAEGEDIEVVEIGIDAALGLIESGGIVDGKTIMLLQHAALRHFR